MSARFKNKVAIVTGAASGIGRATALRMAEEGARVFAVDLSSKGLNDLVAAGDGAIVAVVGDITAPDLPGEILRRVGAPVDVLANVAGVMDGFLAAGEADDATWERTMSVNLTAPFRLMRAVLPGMLTAGAGAIVNVVSEAGLKGGCAGAAYTASKHGLVGLTKNTAFLYATKGIRVNAVAPGPTMTGMRPDFRSAVAAERLPTLIKASISGIAQPEDMASAILWLASPEAANVNGIVLASDNGWSAA